MTNEYIEIIRDGLRAYDSRWKFPETLHSTLAEIVGGSPGETSKSQASKSIYDRLVALRKVTLATQETMYAQVVAEIRLDRILGRGPNGALPLGNDTDTDPELDNLIRDKSRDLASAYLCRCKFEYGMKVRPFEAFQALLAAVEEVEHTFIPSLAEAIVRRFTDQEYW